MKSLKLLGISILCLLQIQSFAQVSPPVHQVSPNKAALFNRLPEKFSANIPVIENLFAGSASRTVKIPLPGNNFFEGTILEKVQKNPNAISINIQLYNYDGALLTLSKITNNDGSVTYTGRIVNIRYADVFTLTKENNQFYFSKEKQSLVV